MTLKETLAISLAAGALFAVGTAHATVDIFLPITGAAFDETQSVGALVHRRGMLVNTNPGGAATATASLGHAEGGENGFTVFGWGNGLPLTCTLVPMSGIYDGFLQQTSATTTAQGVFSMFIDTNLPAGDTFYTISCSIPGKTSNGAAAWILGVDPNH